MNEYANVEQCYYKYRLYLRAVVTRSHEGSYECELEEVDEKAESGMRVVARLPYHLRVFGMLNAPRQFTVHTSTSSIISVHNLIKLHDFISLWCVSS